MLAETLVAEAHIVNILDGQVPDALEYLVHLTVLLL